MKVTTIKTHKITSKDKDLLAILDQYVTSMEEKSVLAITSKIIAICQGRIRPVEGTNKHQLIEKESQYYIPSAENKYGVITTIAGGIIAASAGIDQSNGNGMYVLWPDNPQRVANEVREYLINKYSLKKVGVIITDSRTTPLRWGVTGIAIAHSGFSALNDLIGTPDLFGHTLQITKVNVMDGLAAAAVLVMGESQEQTPLAIIEDMPFVKFQSHNPTKQELADLRIAIEDDVYAAMLKNAPWKKGGAYQHDQEK